MTLKEIIALINSIADKQPNVNSIVKSGDIYDLNSLGNVKFAAFCATQQQHNEDMENGFITYNFNLFYVDRLISDYSNKIDIQSTGIQVLSNVINTLRYSYDLDITTNITYQTYTQSFASECAGVYANVSIIIPVSSLCPELF